MNRRHFLEKSSLAAAGLLLAPYLSNAEWLAKNDFLKLTILHTNDTHSRIDPFPDNHPKFAGMGGFSKRAALIKKIRSEEKNVLLLDAGDIFQGTTYFNFFGGEPEFKLMSEIGYDASTFGNHDFDAGVSGLVKVLPHARFSFINSNYICNESSLKPYIQNYKVFRFGNIRIGIYGLGIDFKDLVLPSMHKGLEYKDALNEAIRVEKVLKFDEKCDFIVCLSHLGFSYEEKKLSDKIIASQTYFTDLIIGGHTHTFLNEKIEVQNLNSKAVLINQVGWAGLILGRIDLLFSLTGKTFRSFQQFNKVR